MSGDTLVNADTGEKIAECTPDEARELTDRICTGLGVVWELVLEAYRTRAWAALGHGSWDAYCAAEFGRFHMRLPSEERDEVIGSLRSAGLSIRAIAATGVASKATVERSIASSGVINEDTCTVGRDGKKYDAVARAKARREAEASGEDSPPAPSPEPGQVSPPAPATSTGEAGADTPSDAAATGTTGTTRPGESDEGVPGDRLTPSSPALPDDWSDRLARATHLLGCPVDLLRERLTDDDRIDLADLRTYIDQLLEEQP